MGITTQAIYEGGALRLIQPLPIDEGSTVEVTIEQTSSSIPMSDEEITRRLREAKTIAEWVDATRLLPGDDDYYNRSHAFCGSIVGPSTQLRPTNSSKYFNRCRRSLGSSST